MSEEEVENGQIASNYRLTGVYSVYKEWMLSRSQLTAKIFININHCNNSSSLCACMKLQAQLKFLH